VLGLPEEICKDTPRFAPYPRYKSSWEYMVRLLGVKLDEQTLYLAPFKTIDLHFSDLQLAGMKLDVSVESGWTRALVDGKPAQLPVKVSRNQKSMQAKFVK
jgi:hypothetical protein